jgi:hypothetical protein
MKFSGKGKVILLGDMNARVGADKDYILEQESNEVPLPNSYTFDLPQPRLNQDMTINICGRNLLELCKMSGLRILNGRTPGDSVGAFTCIRAAGKSTVDYIIADHLLLPNIIYFNVHDITEFSDHCLLEARLNIHYLNETSNIPKPQCKPKWPKFIWDDNAAEIFKTSLLDNEVSNRHAIFLTKEFQNNVNGVDTAVKDLSHIIQAAGVKALKVRYYSNKPNKKNRSRKPWFNDTCKSLKQLMSKLANQIKRKPYDKNLHVLYMTKRKEYRSTIKRQQKEYKNGILQQLSTNYKQNPSAFWNLLDLLKKADADLDSQAECIAPNEWTDHFKLISKTTDKHSSSRLESEIKKLESIKSNDINLNLNAPITMAEIKCVIKNLKNNKSSGNDMILNEMLKHGQSILLPAMAKLFNLILKSNYFPTDWNLSAITPLHKKGSIYDPDNYRGISITSCLGKCFTSVLCNRLITFINENKLISDHQAAFKKKSRTSDHIFTLKSMINNYCVKNKGKLYACFVDFRKAFDSVWRNALLLKLLNYGIRGDFYSLIKHMYSNTISCVKLPAGLSDTFRMELGIRQGDCLSPILFNLFINDIGEIFNDKSSPVSLGTFKLNHLLYADDLVLLSETKEGLQHCLNKLEKYANTWNLEVNTSKTKAVVFQKYGRKANYDFHLGQTQISCTSTYNYLGVLFENNCSYKQTAAELRAKATKASFSLLSTLRSHDYMDTKLHLNLFDKLIKPISTYACEIWLPYQFYKTIKNENYNYDSLPFERLHLMFCKYVLGLNKSASNINVRRELGRLPIITNCFTQIIKYWSYILEKSPESLLYQTYINERENNTDWIKSLKAILNICDLQSHWDTQTPVTENAINNTKLRIRNFFGQYYNTLRQSDSLLKYDSVYNSAKYLSFDISIYFKRLIAKARLQSNRLEVIRGRYSRPSVPRHERICKSCNLEIDDEIHFTTRCPTLLDIRTEMIDKVYATNPHFINLSDKDKTVYLLNPENDEIGRAVGHFIHKAKQLRQF